MQDTTTPAMACAAPPQGGVPPRDATGLSPTLFASDGGPCLFGTALGEDFSRSLVQGMLERLRASDPFELARITVLVNTRRTAQRVGDLLAGSGARLLPRILPVADLDQAFPGAVRGAPAPALRRRLQLARFVLDLLDRQPGLAPRAAAYDLADNLARLIDEMQEEGVSPDAMIDRQVGDLARHWERSAQILAIVSRFFGLGSEAGAGRAAQLAALVARLAGDWESTPPPGPVIVAGSTGSRGTTFRLMRAVALLPQGAVILPGYDFAQPDGVWKSLIDSRAEDHPQYRFARLRSSLSWADVRPWVAHAPSPRGRLLSLAMRPAPVSDQWITEGPRLGDVAGATAGLTLIEAPTVEAEAGAIAVAIRAAVAEGRRVALVTPDRALARRVAAGLDRWGIRADDSAGEPLSQTAPGRLLRHAAQILAAPVRVDQALTILAHPLVHAASGRGRHLDWLRQLELRLRREGRPFPDASDLARLARRDGDDRQEWADWIAGALVRVSRSGPVALADHLRRHIALAETLARGPGAVPPDDLPLWQGPAGERARGVLAELEHEADAGGVMTPPEYLDLVNALLSDTEVRATVEAHPLVQFWGTIEARIQGADLMILAGLNEGVWPALPAFDIWMNRPMRRAAGLRLPERRVGLSAHDFQQGAAAAETILCRAVRDEAAETVPSRWIARLTNLLDGLTGTGRPALAAMRARGQAWLDLADRIAAPDPGDMAAPAVRPSPRPPASARPSRLSVTEIETLIRDPYAIYARHVLGLTRLDPLRPEPDARTQGNIVHGLLERFVLATLQVPSLLTVEGLLDEADATLAVEAHWPGVRELWRGRIEGFAPWFVETERQRQAEGRPLTVEKRAALALGEPPGFVLVGKPDRIDLRADGSAVVVDYKTGSVPSPKQIEHFDRQLPLLAMMAESGVFGGPAGLRVTSVAHMGLGSSLQWKEIALPPGGSERTAAELGRLLRGYLDPRQGFAASRATDGRQWGGDYDHLARFGEWSLSDPAQPEDVG